MMKEKNSLILDQLLAWAEQLCYDFGYVTAMFDTHLHSDNIEKLVDEQRKMKDWWGCMLSNSDAEEGHATASIDNMFIV